MLKLGAAALGRVYQHDLAMVKALDKFVYEQRLFTHDLARRDLSTAHVTTHPDEIADRTIYYPVKLIGVAPQSLGYVGLVQSRRPLGAGWPASAARWIPPASETAGPTSSAGGWSDPSARPCARRESPDSRA